MIIGAHSIVYSKGPEADWAFFRDVLNLTHVDVGEGWLVFGLPPSEVAVHPSGKNNVHEFYLMRDDVKTFIAQMKEHGIFCSEVENQRWGLLTQLTLSGGGQLSVYEPRHARPKFMEQMSKNAGSRSKTTRKTDERKKKSTQKSRRTSMQVLAGDFRECEYGLIPGPNYDNRSVDTRGMLLRH